MLKLAPLLLIGAAAAAGKDPADTPELPPAPLSLRVEVTDAMSPWKLVVTNTGNSPVRFTADGRLLRLEVEPPEEPDESPKAKRKPKKPKTVECKLPLGLRPGGIAEERNVVLAP